MPQHLFGIDHCVILVRDLDQSRDRFSSLGFTMSPRGYHSEHMGSANHTIMLQSDYFELLGIVKPTEHNLGMRTRLEAGEGLNAIALQTDNAAGAVAEIRAMGFAAPDSIGFSRPVTLPSGDEGEAAFTVARFPDGTVPGVYLFACQHHTRPTVWIPELLDHANTATGLARLTAMADDPDAMAAPFRTIFGDAAALSVPGGITIKLPNIPIDILSAAAVAERFPGAPLRRTDVLSLVGLGFKVADLGRATACLDEAAIAHQGDSTRRYVAAEQAAGTVIEFIPG